MEFFNNETRNAYGVDARVRWLRNTLLVSALVSAK